jgi:hypothetical protein
MAERPLLVKIHVGRMCISIPGEYALIGKTGLFVRDVQLLAGTSVVIQFCRGRDKVRLPGIVYAHFANFGTVVEFGEVAGLALQRLDVLQAA